jgi:TonB family protein
MGEDDLELSRLIAPISVENNQPEPEKPKQQNEPQTAKSELPNRKTVMARVDEVQIAPDKISTAPNTTKARPKGFFEVNPNARETDGNVSTNLGRKTTGEPSGFKNPYSESSVAESTKPDIPNPPVIKKPEEKKKVPTNISLGVINGKASYLPKPPYPASARAVGASGAVNVQVMIDERGSVISAKAVSGHPLLRQAAEDAARKAKFTPTYLSETAVKVNGLIVYNFTK